MSLIKFYRANYSSAGITDAVFAELEAAAGHPLATRIDVSLRSETRTASFLAINPNGHVPALVLPSGEPLWESAAITLHLGEVHGVAAGLYPDTAEERAQAAKWIVWVNVNLPMHARTVARVVPGMSKDGGEEEEEEGVRRVREMDAETARGELGRLLGVLDGGLEGKEYLLERGYTLTDTHVWSFMTYIKMLGVDMEKWGNVKRWMESVGGREQLKGL
ncbi:glutathione S-transferase [Beauveria brongniartii RCEF 3172]|uniref:Glutathione S-transferase n=1 Tax=Beauveria brongniartii RCEF 3172 TaxID=1081107 RepID=A0A166YBY8_9HYPO|nr:glutathione S-transferase [Beauveria brongniartii RCEF 3172]